jgi:di/tricarboxylate transporter
MLFGLEINQLVLFIILLGAIVLLFTEWIRINLVAILIILALSLSGVLERKRPCRVSAASRQLC